MKTSLRYRGVGQSNEIGGFDRSALDLDAVAILNLDTPREKVWDELLSLNPSGIDLNRQFRRPGSRP